jgi:hypothetical protein
MSAANEMRMDEEEAAREGRELRPTMAALPSALEQATDCVAEMLGLPRELVRLNLTSLLRRAGRKNGAAEPRARMARRLPL